MPPRCLRFRICSMGAAFSNFNAGQSIQKNTARNAIRTTTASVVSAMAVTAKYFKSFYLYLGTKIL